MKNSVMFFVIISKGIVMKSQCLLGLCNYIDHGISIHESNILYHLLGLTK